MTDARLDVPLRTRFRMKPCAAVPAWAARCSVLGRPNTSGIGAPCVLASHSPRPPRRRTVILKRVLIREFRIEMAAPALRELAGKLTYSHDPGAPFEREKVEDLLADLGANGTSWL